MSQRGRAGRPDKSYNLGAKGPDHEELSIHEYHATLIRTSCSRSKTTTRDHPLNVSENVFRRRRTASHSRAYDTFSAQATDAQSTSGEPLGAIQSNESPHSTPPVACRIDRDASASRPARDRAATKTSIHPARVRTRCCSESILRRQKK